MSIQAVQTAHNPSRIPRRTGQPLVVLVTLLALWIGGRSVLWQSPFPTLLPELDLPAVLANSEARIDGAIPPKTLADGKQPDTPQRVGSVGFGQAPIAMSSISLIPPILLAEDRLAHKGRAKRSLMAQSHQIMWMSAVSSVHVPRAIADLFERTEVLPKNVAGPTPKQSIAGTNAWSLDSWLFLRPGPIVGANSGPLPATYGASQAGAVLRFRIAPGNRHRPTAYARFTQALAGAKESAAAVGVSAWPLSSMPVSAHAEIRIDRVSGRTEVKPAAFAVTEFRPQQLPLGSRLTAYGQAGYVGGRFATGFIDGQARIDREVAGFDLATFRAGAGAWGGAQKDAARLDVGPTASMDITIGDAPARLSMDYRHRIAGDAEPQSGIAITLSTGF